MSAGPLSTFRAAVGHSVNFHQPSVHPRDYPSNFVSAEHSVISVNILCIRVTFRQLASTFVHQRDIQTPFRASMGLSVNFHQPSVHPLDHASNFRMSVGHSVNFPFVRGTFRHVWSTLHLSAVPSVNFHQHLVHPCDLPKCSVRLLNFSQLSVWPWDLLSTFRASARPSVNFLRIRGILY